MESSDVSESACNSDSMTEAENENLEKKSWSRRIRGKRGELEQATDVRRSQSDLDNVSGNFLLEELIRCGALHPCDCGYIFPDEALFKRHTELHSHDGSNQCTACKEKFDDTYKMNAHLIAAHVDWPMQPSITSQCQQQET